MIRLRCARQALSDRTVPGSDSIALEVIYDQSQLHSKTFMIRFKCGGSRLWSDSVALEAVCDPIWGRLTACMRSKCAQIHLRSDSNTLDNLFALEALLVQNQLRSKPFKRRLNCARIPLWSDSSALWAVYDQIQVHSTVFMRSKHPWSRLNSARSCLWSDSSALGTVYDQIQVSSNPSMIILNSARESLCAWNIPSPDSFALEATFDQTQVHSKPFIIKFKFFDSLHAPVVPSNPAITRLNCTQQSLCVWIIPGPSGLNNLFALKAALVQTQFEVVYDETQLCLSSFMIRLKCAWQSPCNRSVQGQTQLHSKLFIIRLKCAQSRLWSDLNALDSLHAIEAFRVRLNCTRSCLWSDSSALGFVYDQS